jgi:ferredoxin
MCNTGGFRNETKNPYAIMGDRTADAPNVSANQLNKEKIMAYVISNDCTMCGACESVCPVEAISAGDGKYVIDAGGCTDCGACEATCPMSAISAA